MKLEVGQFVRTDKVGIKKIYKIDNNKTKYKYLYKLKNQDDDGCIDLGVLCENNIIKASYNRIDILEVGDYVNGSVILDFKYKFNEENDNFTNFAVVTENCYLENTDSWIIEKDIKSVITHEQMEQMAYKVGE